MAKKKQQTEEIDAYTDQIDGYVVVKNGVDGMYWYATAKWVWSSNFKEAWINDDQNRAVSVLNEMKRTNPPICRFDFSRCKGDPFVSVGDPAMNEERDIYRIDQHQLDKEWVEFPKRFYKAAMELADRKADHERAKASRDLTEAELDKELRQEFERLQMKVTEKIVENAVVRHKRMRAAVEEAIKAKHDMDVAQVYVDTLDGVKKALENNVDLFGMNYYSQPRAKGDNYQAAEKLKRDAAFGKKRRDDG